jgi:HEAT repeat protein
MTDAALHSLLAPGRSRGESAGGDVLRAEIQEVMRALSRALRTQLLYEGSTNPALDRFLEQLKERLERLWSLAPAVTLTVDEREVLWEGIPVYTSEDRENVAFILYRDGVREVTMSRGFERGDLDVFLGLLARVQRLRGEDQDDLLTLLWEHDWSHFRYRYVESLPEGAAITQSGGEAPSRVQAREEAAQPQLAAPEDFQGALYFLDATELRRLEGELQREMARDLWTGVLDALFDRLQDGGPLRQEQVVGILADVLPTLLGAGKLELAGRVLGELVGIATSGVRLAGPVMRAVRTLFEQLAQPATVEELVRTVEQSGGAISEAALGQLLSYFPPEALGPLLKSGETSASPAVRRTVLAAAEKLAEGSREHAVQLVRDADPAVAGGAARILGRMRQSTAAGDVARLLQRPEAALRVTAVEALAEIRSPNASGALEAALEDADGKVRVAAARALATLRYAPARAKLEAALDSKRLREAELTERIAFFEAYGGLAGAEGVPLLERTLNGKSWLGRRESAEMRACAALGLGRIRHPAAEKALNAAAADPDPVVRSAVGRALKAIRQ